MSPASSEAGLMYFFSLSASGFFRRVTDADMKNDLR